MPRLTPAEQAKVDQMAARAELAALKRRLEWGKVNTSTWMIEGIEVTRRKAHYGYRYLIADHGEVGTLAAAFEKVADIITS